MVVGGNRLYCGTGIDRAQEKDKGETAIFCFDAATGKPIWKVAAPFPVWSTPIVKDGSLYVTSGNGDVLADAEAPEKPGGALQCLDAETGAEKWRVTVPNGIIQAPAVDAHRIYFGCRDGNVYCVNRADGKERWKRDLGSAVVGTPVLDCDPVYERSLSVFALSTQGKVSCLNPHNGQIVWLYDLTDKNAAIATSPRLVVTRTADGYSRQLYFGCGLGGGPNNVIDNRPVFYCLEDQVKVE
jgi:outer membrane protein assembly factor BamB